MDVLTPHSLDEALRLKAAHPDAVPIQGGTDVMIALNFDRARPLVLLNLNEVGELRGWSRENGTLRLGAGLTYTEMISAKGFVSMDRNEMPSVERRSTATCARRLIAAFTVAAPS